MAGVSPTTCWQLNVMDFVEVVKNDLIRNQGVCVAVCCSVLQCVAVCCREVQLHVINFAEVVKNDLR